MQLTHGTSLGTMAWIWPTPHPNGPVWVPLVVVGSGAVQLGDHKKGPALAFGVVLGF